MKTVASLIQRLNNSGLRPTPQRVAVLTFLFKKEGPNRHVSAEDVYTSLVAEYPTLSRTTVYQTLESLCKCDIISKLTFNEGEMLFDAETTPHGHFKCTKCGGLFDFAYPSTAKFPPPPSEYLVQETYLYYKGLCRKCRPAS